MGFLSKLMKNPMVQMALPIALSMFMPGMGAAFASKFPAMSGIFSGMNPMAANMLKQSALGYGTAKLTGSEHPEKAAMYAGLASLPFSYMSASQAANTFNKQYAGKQGMERYLKSPGVGFGEGLVDPGLASAAGMGTVNKPAIYGFQKFGTEVPKLSAWDILSGEKAYAKKYGFDPETFRGIKTADYTVPTDAYDPEGLLTTSPKGPGDAYEKLMTGKTVDFPTADIFSKTSQGGVGFGGIPRAPAGTVTADWIPTMASQTAGMYGGRMTPEEEWEAAQKKRKKELAWMYGVPEDMIEGEMTNPWSSGSFWNRGGIASLENGGDVSGPGTGTSDSINANLSDGEFVMTAKAVENLGNGDRYEGARQMYDLMNVLDPESETMSEVV